MQSPAPGTTYCGWQTVIAFSLSPFFLLQWNSVAYNSSVGMAQA